MIANANDRSGSFLSPNGDRRLTVWFKISVPLWKAPDEGHLLTRRVSDLERELSELKRTVEGANE